MASVNELFEQAMKLSSEEREELADRLFQSVLPDPPGEDLSPDEWERVWMEEIKRRSDELHEGKTQTLDAWESLRRIRRELEEGRQS
jgi:putative addiction module component (TIGR02574 family)